MKKYSVIIFFPLLIILVVNATLNSVTVVLQPGTEGKDTYICDCEPDENNPNGSITHLYQGQYSNCFDRILIAWDLSSIPLNITITEAIMELNYNTLYGTPMGEMVYYRILEDWVEEEVTYNTEPAYDPDFLFACTWPTEEWHAVDLTAFVQYWIDEPANNFGVYGHCRSTTATCVAEFNSSDHSNNDLHPKLTITYELNSIENQEFNPEIASALSNYPNPFNPTTEICFQLQESSKIKLSVYNMKGQLLNTLVNEMKPAGLHSISWDGKDKAQQSLPSGIYYYLLETGEDKFGNKMVLIK